jgi:hypothetical protein
MTEEKKKLDLRAVIMGLMVLGAVASLVGEYLAQDKTPTLPEAISFVLVGIAAWLAKGPGHLTAQEADELAEQRAHDAVEKNSLPPLDHL